MVAREEEYRGIRKKGKGNLLNSIGGKFTQSQMITSGGITL